MCDVQITWDDDAGNPHTGVYGLIDDPRIIEDADSTQEEPHLWFRARDGRVFGMPSKDVHSILAVTKE